MLREIEKRAGALPAGILPLLGKVEVQVEQGRNLQACDLNGLSDPYVRVSLGTTVYQTTIIYENLNPVWSKQLFVFDVIDETPLLFNLWDKDNTSNDDYMGLVEIPCSAFARQSTNAAWYPITKKKDASSRKKKQRGDLFLRTTWIDYRSLLVNLLTPSLSALRLLCLKVASDDTTASLVYVLRIGRRLFDLARLVTAREVQTTSDPNTLFRSTSMSTKLCTIFAYLVGQQYLVDTLQPIMLDFCDEALEIEIEASRLTGDNIESRVQDSQTRMLEFVTMMLSAIIKSAESAPPLFRAMAITLQQLVGGKWGFDSPYVQVAVGSYTMLRFFNPAIIDPGKFGLLGPNPSPPSPKIIRRLVLASKILQSIANNGAPLKAQSMEVFNTFIELSVQKLHAYFDGILQPLQSPLPSDIRPEPNPSELIGHLDNLCDWIHATSSQLHDNKLNPEDYLEAEIRTLLTQVELHVIPTLFIQRASTPVTHSETHRHGRLWLRRTEKH